MIDSIAIKTTEEDKAKGNSGAPGIDTIPKEHSESSIFSAGSNVPVSSIAGNNMTLKKDSRDATKSVQEHASPNMGPSRFPSTNVSPQFEDAPEDPFGDHSNQTSFPRPRRATSSLEALAALACANADADVDAARRVSVIPSSTEETQTEIPSLKQKADVKPASRVVSDETLANSGDKASSFQISPHDVLCGRGGLTNHHPGNVTFRTLVRHSQEAYLRASKRDKAGVARKIVDTIRSLTGRFLKKDPSNPGVWVEIGNRKAREKTSQALREGAPELREELSAAQAITTDAQGQIHQPGFSGARIVTNDIADANSDQSFTPLAVPSSLAPIGLNFAPRRFSSFDQPSKMPHVVSDEDQPPSPGSFSPSDATVRALSPSFVSHSRGAEVLASLASGFPRPKSPMAPSKSPRLAPTKKRKLNDESRPDCIPSSDSDALVRPSSPPACAVQERASEADQEGPPRRRFKARMMEKCF